MSVIAKIWSEFKGELEKLGWVEGENGPVKTNEDGTSKSPHAADHERWLHADVAAIKAATPVVEPVNGELPPKTV